MKKHLYLFLASIFFWGCEYHSDKSGALIDSSTPVKTTTTHLSSILTVKSIVPLETSDVSLIGDFRKIQKFQDRIYVSYNRKTLLVFDEHGKFLRKIGSVGQGVGEYNHISNFDVTPNGIYLNDYYKIQHYDLEGRFIETIPFQVCLAGLNITQDKILGFVTRDESVCHIFTLDGKCINKFHPESEAATIFQSSYYWPYKDDKYLFPFFCVNDILVYDAKENEYEYTHLIDLPDMLTLDKANQLFEEKGGSLDMRDYACVVTSFCSNSKQMFLITYKGKDRGILWTKNWDSGETKAFDCAHLVDDISFSKEVEYFFTSFARSNDSFLAFVFPQKLKEGVQEADEALTLSPFYKQMKELADSLSEEDNPIIIEYEFK